MPGTRIGVLRQAAQRTGCASLEEYQRRIERQKWCTGCKRWVDPILFALDALTWDGLGTECRECRAVRSAAYWQRPGVRERKAAMQRIRRARRRADGRRRA